MKKCEKVDSTMLLEKSTHAMKPIIQERLHMKKPHMKFSMSVEVTFHQGSDQSGETDPPI